MTLKKKSKSFLQTIILYTLCFILTSCFILSIYLKYKKGFMWNGDALQQHFITLDYFRDILLNFFQNGKISFFTWKIGTGLDMFSNLAYYILGDFFSYFSVSFSKDHLYLYYYFLVFARLYLIGLSFLCYCKHRKMNSFSSNIGALMYTFCSYSLFSFVRHPYFSLAIALFPLLCIGIENLVQENKWKYYVLIVSFSTIVNFYFSYSMFLIIGIYAIILTIHYNKENGIKTIILKLFKYLGYSLLGVACASMILIPTIYSFLQSARSSSGVFSYPYSVDYFSSLFSSLITVETSNWRIYGVQSIILLTLPIFFEKKKENKPIKILLIVLFIPILFSKVGSIFMFFSYPTLRWSYVISFFFAYITTSFLNEERELVKKDLLYISIFLLVYIFNIILQRANISNLFMVEFLLGLAYIFIYSIQSSIIKKFTSPKLFRILVFIFFVIGLLYTCNFMFDCHEKEKCYSKEFLNFSEHQEIYNTDYRKIPDFKDGLSYIKNQDDSHYLINTQFIPMQNISLINDYNSLPIYYSIIPKYLSNLSKDLENRQASMNHETQNFDFRTQITTLLGTKYYMMTNDNSIPYGYVKMPYNGNTKIYKNKYALPFGIFYTNYINEEEYKKLSPIEKESALFKTVVLDKNVNKSIEHNEDIIKEIKENMHKDLFYSIEKNDILETNKIKIESTKNNKIILNIEGFQNSELYLYIKGLEYQPFNKEEMISREIEKIKNIENNLNEITTIKSKYKNYIPNTNFSVNVKFQNKNFEETTEDKRNVYYLENKDYLMNLGYYDYKEDEKIEIQFSKLGNYTFEDIKVVAVSMKDYENDVEKLKQSNFELLEMTSSKITAKAKVEEEGILQFRTLYSKGWKIFIDGKEQTPMLVNQYFLGVPLEKGEHKITLEYHTPYLKLGVIISLFSITTFIGLSYYEKSRKKP